MIRRGRHVGEQRERRVSIVAQRVANGILVELTDVRRDLLEARMPGEVAPRRGAPSRLRDGCVRIRSFGS
ncbi:MAG TPA: hypothetical protein VGC84_03175 [Ilumatobacteraceae bacterium]